MFERVSVKLGQAQAIYGDGEFKSSGDGPKSGQNKEQTALKKKQVEELLKMGMLAFLNNNEKDKNMFEEDIDQILEQRTRINTNLEVFSAITYSKTSFASNAHSSNQIDINDPNFWNKVLPQESVTLGILQ